MSKRYTYEELIEIIALLRSENGCPWDKVQTHESLKPCMLEEAAELVASIRIYDKTGNAENMIEELGDVLLQVIMHSQIGKEEGIFTLEDVINEISQKMIRRHPHVFGGGPPQTREEVHPLNVENKKINTPDQVLAKWDDIKKKEKENKIWIESPLKEIPKEFPALTRAPKILKKIDTIYEPRKGYAENVSILEEELAKLKKLPEGKLLENIIGNMLITISDISRQFKLSQEQILIDKMEDLIDFYEG